MIRRLFLCLLAIFGLIAPPRAQVERPNIIYLMADDLGYADLSCYGRKDYQTPHLDKLASEGMKFLNAYAAAALCTPTRTAFMTGRYPARTPVGLMEPLRWKHKDSIIGLTPEYTSIASLLKRNGYETYLVGKWHLGYDLRYSPNKNGFDYFFGFNSGGIDYISHTNPKGQSDLYENETPIKKGGYLTDIWAKKAIEIIESNHTKPFFLSVMFNAPHWPWQAPGDKPYPDTMNWHTGGSKEKYAAMINSLDQAVGKMMKALDGQKLTNQTLVIFTSDNGGEEFSDMGIYSGIKEELLEGGIKEPAFVRWPGVIAAGSSTRQVAITMDWTATILAAAVTKPDPAFPLDGMNLLPVLKGGKEVMGRTFFWRLSQEKKQKAIRDGDWKYLQNEKGEFLFNLEKDPGEKKDLKKIYPAKFIKLKKKYRDWEATVLKPIPL